MGLKGFIDCNKNCEKGLCGKPDSQKDQTTPTFESRLCLSEKVNLKFYIYSSNNLLMRRQIFILFLLFISVFSLHAQTDGLAVKQGDKGLYLEHTVSGGQGLYSVGRLYNVNPKYLASFNKIDFNKGLEIGQVIRIPLTDTNFTQKNNKGVPVYYTVGPSEGLLRVSNMNNKVTMQKLREWNGLKSDALQVGQKLIVGYLISKDMPAYLASVKQDAPKAEEKPIVKVEPTEEKPKAQPVTIQTEPAQVAKADPPKEDPKKEEARREEPKRSVPVEAATSSASVASNAQGYFRQAFEQQVKQNPVSKNATVTAGVFKTSSGWEDAKYYLLVDGVATGTIVQLINPDNNKAIYAKVLGEMNGIRQNQGLGIRISNAGAAALGITDSEKFILRMTY